MIEKVICGIVVHVPRRTYMVTVHVDMLSSPALPVRTGCDSKFELGI
jgi:hypothetical protein